MAQGGSVISKSTAGGFARLPLAPWGLILLAGNILEFKRASRHRPGPQKPPYENQRPGRSASARGPIAADRNRRVIWSLTNLTERAFPAARLRGCEERERLSNARPARALCRRLGRRGAGDGSRARDNGLVSAKAILPPSSQENTAGW